MGTNYPLVLIAAILLNFIIANLILAFSQNGDWSLFQRLMKLFEGNIGHFFSSFVGMLILMILLLVAVGESQTGSIALKSLIGINLKLEYYLILFSVAALVPILIGIKRGLSIVFGLFVFLIFLKALFIALFLVGNQELPDWSYANIYNSLQFSDVSGSHGIIYIGFRLAFWSLIAIELFNVWKGTGLRSTKKLKFLFYAGIILILTMIPGIYIAGVFPLELWKLIVLSEEGCFGACPSMAIGLNFGGKAGLLMMGTSTILSHLLLVSISFILISRTISYLSKRKLFFGVFQKKKYALKMNNSNTYTLFLALMLSVLLSMLNLNASYWVGLSLYLSFAFIMVLQIMCLLNVKYRWFENAIIASRSLCVLTALSIVMMGIMFYSGFKDQHFEYINFAIAILCFSLWVAATSLVYLVKFKEV